MPKPTVMQKVLGRPSRSYTSATAAPTGGSGREYHLLRHGLLRGESAAERRGADLPLSASSSPTPSRAGSFYSSSSAPSASAPSAPSPPRRRPSGTSTSNVSHPRAAPPSSSSSSSRRSTPDPGALPFALTVTPPSPQTEGGSAHPPRASVPSDKAREHEIARASDAAIPARPAAGPPKTLVRDSRRIASPPPAADSAAPSLASSLRSSPSSTPPAVGTASPPAARPVRDDAEREYFTRPALMRQISIASTLSTDSASSTVFYTPAQSPATSPRASAAFAPDHMALPFLLPSALAALAAKLPGAHAAASGSDSASDDNDTATDACTETETASSSSPPPSDLFSSSSHPTSASTHPTAPPSSSSSHTKPAPAAPKVPGAGTRRVPPAHHRSGSLDSALPAPAPVQRRRSGSGGSSRTRSIDAADDWAREVLWLAAPPTGMRAPPPVLPPVRAPTGPARPRLPSTSRGPPPVRRRSSNGSSRSGGSGGSGSSGGLARSMSDRTQLRRRMSAVFEEPEDDRERESSAGGSARHGHARSLTAPHPPRPARSRGSSSAASHVAPADLPAPMPELALGGAGNAGGYTGLVLPRAAYVPASGARVRGGIAGGAVDLTRSGAAQTTMATVEVVAGIAAASAAQRRLFALPRPFRRRTSSVPASAPPSRETPLAFTSHVAPPAHVPSTGVLVRVAAVGLDGVDGLLVRAQLGARGGVGFVPGRSVVGRAVEVGGGVREAWVRKGEWVVGLLDVRKSGALAEFVVLDRRHVHRVARPANTAGWGFVPPGARGPTLEQLALLPLCGIPAYRAVRTFVRGAAWSAAGGSAPPRALVLHAHDGAGALALQLLAQRGVHATAHVPLTHPRLDVLVRRLRAAGAHDVFPAPTPLAALDTLARAGARFHFVLDTVGGRAVWEHARRLLAAAPGDAADDTERLFATLVGDAPEKPVPSGQAHFRAGMRALGFGRGGHGGGGSSGSDGEDGGGGGGAGVGYALVSVAADVDLAGEDVRDALAALVALTEDGQLRPSVPGQRAAYDDDEDYDDGDEEEAARRVLPFERAPELFADGGRLLADGGTAVVRVAS